MELGTRLRYGMLAMLELARRGGGVPVRAEDIAKAERLSKGYLEGLLAALRRAGLVRAVRGPGGGWVLARSASRVRAIDVYLALEGPTPLAPCVENRALCPRKAKACRARRLWVAVTRAIERELRAQTLAALAGVGRSAGGRPVKSRPARRRSGPKSTRKPKRTRPRAKPAARPKAKRPADKKRAALVRSRQIVDMVKTARSGRGRAKLRRSA